MTKLILYGKIRHIVKGYMPKLKGGELKCHLASSKSMKRKSYWQCTVCGKVHHISQTYKIDSDDIYKEIYCVSCEEETRQLWCGEDILDFYELYDGSKDERYFIY